MIYIFALCYKHVLYFKLYLSVFFLFSTICLIRSLILFFLFPLTLRRAQRIEPGATVVDAFPLSLSVSFFLCHCCHCFPSPPQVSVYLSLLIINNYFFKFDLQFVMFIKMSILFLGIWVVIVIVYIGVSSNGIYIGVGVCVQ